MKALPRIFLLCHLALGAVSLAHAAPTNASIGAIERAEADKAKSLLEDAVSYLQKNGTDKAFKAFSRRDGEFAQGSYYVYVMGLDGMMVAHGAAPEVLVGTNVTDLRDAAGKPFIREMLDKAATSGSGSVEYRWLNRSNNHVELKTALFTKVDNHVVSVGYYLPRSTEEEAQGMLDKAVAQMKKSGATASYRKFNDPKGAFIRGDLYVFAIGLEDGKYRASGAAPRLVGKNVRDMRDAEGKPLVQEMIALVKEKGSGTVDYVWRNPATNAVEPKHSLVQRVNDVVVGVGYYSKQK
ncbi:cache domain-containing protein [Noviherbaspirillum denitrificans]|uniref:Chemotaxis protein n=1 Tax=Noviherbaspirillum denitrificans TaxID=1968433 RepID=A0A254T667_9BURK|nr:cache domain-containing protein [Noviherbaspirillum denitrificans]OWW18105.1 chemotaxis protein [Noviherbaspirillum denitrificans]